MKINKLYNLESVYANEPGFEPAHFLILKPIFGYFNQPINVFLMKLGSLADW